MIFDSHAHLDDKRFDVDRDELIKKMQIDGVTNIINVGCDIKSSQDSIALANKYDFIYASCGIHPHDASSYNDDIEKELIELLKNDKVIAIGEIGLDYHYDFSPRDIQKEVYKKQIILANDLKMPIIIHDREAHKDVFEILKGNMSQSLKGVFHSYSGSAEMINNVLDLDFYVSFSGVATFKNNKKTIEAIRKAPLDKILIETDSPYLTPEPFRGKRNDSSKVIYVAKTIASVKNIPYESVLAQTNSNTKELFKIND